MKVIKDIGEMQKFSDSLKKDGRKIGFVPTMGFLHDGHLSLINESKRNSDITIVSIYINPTQFSPNEDFDKYPRDFEHDEKMCKDSGVDVIFYPDEKRMYSNKHKTFVVTDELSNRLCGISRPEHFRGVTTIVAKLFNIVKPDVAIFGQKDAQQSIIIKRMVEDLNIDIDIIIAPIVREAEGLAMSSRNKYLSPKNRKDASIIHSSLLKANELVLNGEKQSKVILNLINNHLVNVSDLKVEYISIVDMNNLDPIENIGKNTLIAIAVYFGSTRLIDNIIIN